MIFVVHISDTEFYNTTTLSKHLKYFRYTARAFGHELRYVDSSGVVSATGTTEDVYPDLASAIDGLPGIKVLVETPDFFIGESCQELGVYQFDIDSVVIIGPDYGGVDVASLGDYEGVYIDTTENVPLWSFVVMGIVAYGSSV